jgi:hypothetical protein
MAWTVWSVLLPPAKMPQLLGGIRVSSWPTVQQLLHLDVPLLLLQLGFHVLAVVGVGVSDVVGVIAPGGEGAAW